MHTKVPSVPAKSAAAGGKLAPATEPQTFLRLPDVVRVTGKGRSQIYAEIAAGTFPKPVKISARAVAWLEKEILAWQAGCIAARDTRAA